MSHSTRRPSPGTFAALALIAAGLTGTIVDNDGRAGLALFIAGAAGVLFLVVRQLARAVAPRRQRPQLAGRRSIPKIVTGRTVAVAVVAMGVLLSATNLFKATDDDALSRALNYAAWYGFLLLVISLGAVAVASVGRWVARSTAGGRH